MFAAQIKLAMQRVGKQFTRFETDGGYSLINTAIPNLGKSFYELLNTKEVNSFYLCTTNYDGILDSLLTYYCGEELKRKFVLKDGFIHGHFENSLFRRSKYKIAHLHGSYKYFKSSDSTIKLERGVVNSNPVMIYDDPNCKEAAIRQDSVLSANLLELEYQLKVCDRVIIIGNSFKTEPHLKRLINTHFNRPNTQIIISSDKPEEVASTLEPYYNFPIYTQSTMHIRSEQHLIELFKKLFDSNYYRMLATA
ncbi:hypothetical protein [Pontibacter populi]|uniref:SIR2-like domain-containing protein n=1 Tax=Pontibacter populi TaxID=890055 RepID=A0ABS6XAN7_9BACT|nr:hypothetical protein [Pontibacter populi]MBW3364563.1 hypothetical protein [Pontibacter populi]